MLCPPNFVLFHTQYDIVTHIYFSDIKEEKSLLNLFDRRLLLFMSAGFQWR